MRDELRERLVGLGASEDDLRRAEAEGWLPLLALDRMLMPGTPEYDVAAVADTTGIDEALLRRLWRALGFPDVPPDARVFTESEVRAASRLIARADADQLGRTMLVQQVQVVSAAMARIASVEADAIAEVLHRLTAAGLTTDQVTEGIIDSMRWDDLAALIDYEHRLQLRAALWRRLTLEAAPDLAFGVGFVDLAGYTKATEHLDAAEIAELVSRWEECAYDTVTEHGARVVKTIGDEVMLVGLPGEVVDAVLALRDAAADDPTLLPVRAGVAAGPVVARNGDFYGPVVNLASRLTEIAPSGTVFAPATLRSDLADRELRWESRGVRHLRSIGSVEVWAVDRAG